MAHLIIAILRPKVVKMAGKHKATTKRKGGIHLNPAHKGLLHKEMGIKQSSPISTEALEHEKAGASPAEKKRIVFTENARKWHH